LKKGNYPSYVGHRWLQIEDYQWIAPFRNNPGWYINHSCSPNSGIKNSVNIVAMKNIGRDEEVTFDYSTSESEYGWYLICHCESRNCRRIIKPYYYLSTELKLKYRDFISEYLKRSNPISNVHQIRAR
jgi:SET domain-containing protein